MNLNPLPQGRKRVRFPSRPGSTIDRNGPRRRGRRPGRRAPRPDHRGVARSRPHHPPRPRRPGRGNDGAGRIRARDQSASCERRPRRGGAGAPRAIARRAEGRGHEGRADHELRRRVAPGGGSPDPRDAPDPLTGRAVRADSSRRSRGARTGKASSWQLGCSRVPSPPRRSDRFTARPCRIGRRSP